MTKTFFKIPAVIASVYLIARILSPEASAQVLYFEKQEVNLSGRLRHLTLENVYSNRGKNIVVVEREGEFPNWKSRISVWDVHGLKQKPTKLASIELPNDSLFFGFGPIGSDRTSAPLFVVRPAQLEVWNDVKGRWQPDAKQRVSLESPFSNGELGDVAPYRPLMSANGNTYVLAPALKGISSFIWRSNRLEKGPMFEVPPHAYYHSAIENRPLELPFWVRGTLWYPMPALGRLTGNGPERIFWPWMDEVGMTGLDGAALPTHLFRRFTESERDDGIGYAMVIPEDLNTDGRIDFVVNKFVGSTTSLKGETSVYFTAPDGTIPNEGKMIKPQGNRAGGALVLDLDRDGQKDLIVATSQFNGWAIARALIRHRVDVQFSFYMGRPDGYHLELPDFQREISFRFSLSDADIDGILPSLDGDFNGDGLTDVVYAGDRETVSVVLQRPKTKEIFTAYPNAVFSTKVPRNMRVGDLDGDGKSDLVLYESRSTGGSGNRIFSVLLNTGALKSTAETDKKNDD